MFSFRCYLRYHISKPPLCHFVPIASSCLFEYTHGFIPSLYEESTLSKLMMLKITVTPIFVSFNYVHTFSYISSREVIPLRIISRIFIIFKIKIIFKIRNSYRPMKISWFEFRIKENYILCIGNSHFSNLIMNFSFIWKEVKIRRFFVRDQ